MGEAKQRKLALLAGRPWSQDALKSPIDGPKLCNLMPAGPAALPRRRRGGVYDLALAAALLSVGPPGVIVRSRKP